MDWHGSHWCFDKPSWASDSDWNTGNVNSHDQRDSFLINGFVYGAGHWNERSAESQCQCGRFDYDASND